MEITSFILGVCAVIILMMVVGTFVNHMAIKNLKLQFDNLDKYANRIEQKTNQGLIPKYRIYPKVLIMTIRKLLSTSIPELINSKTRSILILI